ncbi:MAG: hypothetical protein AB8C84_11530 [Oligoflexales bacterium]
MNNILNQLDQEYKHHSHESIFTFAEFLSLVQKQPRMHIRSSAQYTLQMFEHYGKQKNSDEHLEDIPRYHIFDVGSERSGPIIGGESTQHFVHNILKRFSQEGATSRLIVLHGPNGSAKTSTVESISEALSRYSQTHDGAVYRFNWIFPTERGSALEASTKGGSRIGFGQEDSLKNHDSFAKLDQSKIAAKITSEFKENPLFLLPPKMRSKLLKDWLEVQNDHDHIPRHITLHGLSKQNQEIFDTLLATYDGSLSKVLNHIQVERFYFSRQYRIGISTISPQMSIDAVEKQITIDRNYSNLPAALQTINFRLCAGELVEANRGILEYSDLLKRPIEAFKYLLSTIERGVINFPSGSMHMDSVLMATTNEKHLDAFKTSPDFASFKGRFELITVPYLLDPEKEENIYSQDILNIERSQKITPHTLELLCLWSVMTRIKQPELDLYPKEIRQTLSKLDPYSKILLYQGKRLPDHFTSDEKSILTEYRKQLWSESQHMLIYEGRFGASPREIKTILHQAAQKSHNSDLTPLDIFNELEKLIKDRTVFEFLQFEPRGKYHDVHFFLSQIQDVFFKKFEDEFISAMGLAGDNEYTNLLDRYITNVVAIIRKERIWDDITASYQQPSEDIVSHVESLLEIPNDQKNEHRNNILNRIAAHKLDHPDTDIHLPIIFEDVLIKIRAKFYADRSTIVEDLFSSILAWGAGEKIDDNAQEKVSQIMKDFHNKFHYTKESSIRCLQALIQYKKRISID